MKEKKRSPKRSVQFNILKKVQQAASAKQALSKNCSWSILCCKGRKAEQTQSANEALEEPMVWWPVNARLLNVIYWSP